MGEEKFCFVLRSGLNSRLILDGLLGVRGIGCVLMNEEQEGAMEQQGAQARQSERKDRRGKKRTTNQERTHSGCITCTWRSCEVGSVLMNEHTGRSNGTARCTRQSKKDRRGKKRNSEPGEGEDARRFRSRRTECSATDSTSL